MVCKDPKYKAKEKSKCGTTDLKLKGDKRCDAHSTCVLRLNERQRAYDACRSMGSIHPNLSMCVVPTVKFADGMAAIAANQFAEVRTQSPIVSNCKYISIIKTHKKSKWSVCMTVQ